MVLGDLGRIPVRSEPLVSEALLQQVDALFQ